MRDTELIEKFSKLTPDQRKTLESDILSLLLSDTETLGELTNLKHGAYKIYTVDIAHLIAELEVHSHDLPKWIYGLLEMIFRLCATAAIQNEDNAMAMYRMAIRYERSLINIINLALIDYYVKELRRYKRTMVKFNHHAVRTEDDTAIVSAISCGLKKISALKKVGYKTFRKRYKFNKRNCSLEFKLDADEELIIPELENSVNEARKGISLCEEFYPVVISNGFISNLPARIVHYLPTVISFILAVIGAMILIPK